MAFLRWLILALGVLLLGVVLYRTGLSQLWEDLVRQGWAIVPYLLLTGVENGFHSLSCRRCVSPEHRGALSWWRLFQFYHLAHAINLVTPTAEVGGDIARAMAMQRYVPGSESASSVVINKFTFSIARMMVAASLTGMAVLLFPMRRLNAVLIGLGSALMTLALLLFAVFQAKGLFSAVLAKMARVTGPKSQEWVRTHVGELDRRLKAFYTERRGDLALSILYDTLGFGVGILQRTYLMTVLLSKPGEPWRILLAAGAAVWGITNLIDMIFFFVAARLGVHEGGYKMAFEAIGLSGEKGVAMSLLDRLDQLFWTAFGLVVYFVYLVRKTGPQGVSEPTPDRAA
jgi:hypothetical protein